MKSTRILLIILIFISTSAYSFTTRQDAPGVEYGVQIMLSKKHLDANNNKFKGVTDIHEEIIDGVYKYTTGRVKSSSEAQALATKMHEVDFKGAFIVRYKDGQRSTLNASAKPEDEKPMAKAETVKEAPVQEETPKASKQGKEKPAIGAAMVQQSPQFKGGQDSLNSFIIANRKYPDEKYQKVEDGQVVVSFSVDYEGKIKDPKVVKSVSKQSDAEALRIIRLMPDWNPGTIGGHAASMEVLLPVDFYRSFR